MTNAPTTPLPRATAAQPAAPEAGHSVAATVGLWLLIVTSVVGGGGFYAYKRGWLLASTAPIRPDTTLAARDTALRVDSAGPAESTASDSSKPAHDTTHAAAPAPGTPGKLTLAGVPLGAKVFLAGQPVKGSQLDVPPGVYKLSVKALGYEPFERQVVITPGASSTVRVDLQTSSDGDEASGGGPCDQYGPAYNQDNVCFDTRPLPLSSTLIPIPADAPIFPREVILLFHVSKGGETLEVRIFVRSNVDTFNDQALDVAKSLRWNPAEKNGDPVDAWVQWPFKPVRS